MLEFVRSGLLQKFLNETYTSDWFPCLTFAEGLGIQDNLRGRQNRAYVTFESNLLLKSA